MTHSRDKEISTYYLPSLSCPPASNSFNVVGDLFVFVFSVSFMRMSPGILRFLSCKLAWNQKSPRPFLEHPYL